MADLRIYVASLSDYNNGRLEGKWLDLDDYSDASELMEAISDMLNDLTKKYNDGEVREEYAVHDYEGIPSTLASEYMGEQDFQQLYDIKEVAEDTGLPFEVLVERAGDTGSDDYQALADSLMFVVDGNDETDIVYEYENQLGDLGNDFWSNHIYIDDVTERVMYSEDVDRFREDILDENPDLDEDEVERQAEEMADEEAERREDLTNYLEDYDTIPNFVSKDYDGAWSRSLSYDFDVIHHNGEMYVFSNNYSLGGTVLSGMIGAYIGYQVGKKGLKQVASNTRNRIGKASRKVKRVVKSKKFARGGLMVKVGDMVYPETETGLWKVIEVGSKKTNKDKLFMGSDYYDTVIQDEDGNKLSYPSNRFRVKEMGRGGKAQGIEWMKTDGQYEAEFGDLYLIISPATERGLYNVKVKDGYRGETIGESKSEVSGLNNAKDLAYDIAGDFLKQFAKGGGVTVYSSDEMYELNVFDGKTNNLLETKRFRARNQKEAKSEAEDLEYTMHEKYGDYLNFKLGLAKPLMAKGGGVGNNKFSMSKTTNENGKITEMVIAENVSVNEFNKLFSDKAYRKVNDKSLVGFYFAKPNGDTIQLIPSFHKKGEILKYAKGGMTEHGLEIGDEVMGYTKSVNELHVLNRKNDEWHSVDLDDGKRYENGGGISGLNDLIRG